MRLVKPSKKQMRKRISHLEHENVRLTSLLNSVETIAREMLRRNTPRSATAPIAIGNAPSTPRR